MPGPVRRFFTLMLLLGLLAGALQAGMPCNPHGDWGARISLQDSFAICSINSFLQDKGRQFGLPDGMAVKPHQNGYSLTYHWTDEDGNLPELHQTARPSVWFAIISLNGVTINAQERGWGFVTGFRGFGASPPTSGPKSPCTNLSTSSCRSASWAASATGLPTLRNSSPGATPA